MFEYEWCDRCSEDLEGSFFIGAVGWDEEFSAPIVEVVCRKCSSEEE